MRDSLAKSEVSLRTLDHAVAIFLSSYPLLRPFVASSDPLLLFIFSFIVDLLHFLAIHMIAIRGEMAEVIGREFTRAYSKSLDGTRGIDSCEKTGPWCVPLPEGERVLVPRAALGNDELRTKLVICDI